MIADGHNEVDTISLRHSCLLALSARRLLINLYWPIFDRQAITAAILVNIDGVVTTIEDESRSRLPRGLYGNNMIDQKIGYNVSSDLNDQSHSWPKRKPIKKTKTILMTVTVQ